MTDATPHPPAADPGDPPVAEDQAPTGPSPATGFDARFDELARTAYRVAYRMLGDREEARDIAQEALARAYARWPKVEANASAWVSRVATNLALDHIRRRRPTERSRDPDTDVAQVAALRSDLVRALRTLPRRQRDVVVLRYLADVSEAEVAALLGCRGGPVKRGRTGRARPPRRVLSAHPPSWLCSTWAAAARPWRSVPRWDHRGTRTDEHTMAQTESGSYPNDGPHPGDAAYPSGGTYPGGTGHPGGFYPGGGTYPSGPAYGGYPEYSAGAAGPYGVVMGPGPAPRRKMNGIEIVSLLAAAVIALGAAVVCSFLSVGLAFATDSCSATECSDAAATSFMGNALAQFAVVVLVIVCLALYRTSVKIRVGIMLGGAVLSVVALVLAYWYAASIIDGHS